MKKHFLALFIIGIILSTVQAGLSIEPYNSGYSNSSNITLPNCSLIHGCPPSTYTSPPTFNWQYQPTTTYQQPTSTTPPQTTTTQTYTQEQPEQKPTSTYQTWQYPTSTTQPTTTYQTWQYPTSTTQPTTTYQTWQYPTSQTGLVVEPTYSQQTGGYTGGGTVCVDDSVYTVTGVFVKKCPSNQYCANGACIMRPLNINIGNTQIGLGPFCRERYIGDPYCLGNEVWQDYRTSNCRTTPKFKMSCEHGCKDGECITVFEEEFQKGLQDYYRSPSTTYYYYPQPTTAPKPTTTVTEVKTCDDVCRQRYGCSGQCRSWLFGCRSNEHRPSPSPNVCSFGTICCCSCGPVQEFRPAPQPTTAPKPTTTVAPQPTTSPHSYYYPKPTTTVSFRAEPQCTEGWICLDAHTKAYRGKNCEIVTTEYCLHGCENGACRPKTCTLKDGSSAECACRTDSCCPRGYYCQRRTGHDACVPIPSTRSSGW